VLQCAPSKYEVLKMPSCKKGGHTKPMNVKVLYKKFVQMSVVMMK